MKGLRILGLLVCLFGGIASAQVSTGTISGTVRDSSGAALAGTQVVILNEETGISRTVETNADGLYSAPSLNLGHYRVTATAQGFQTEVRSGIVLTVGQVATVDLSLAVGSVDQKVVVTGEAPMVESTTASLGSLVDDRMIRALPLNGRSYDQLALLQPGVVLTSPGSNLGGTPFTLGTGERFSVGGQRSTANSFLLDGTNINDQGNGTPGGAAGLNLGVDTILEFKIFTNSFKAEYGHSDGSVVNAVTRSGTNTLHGTAFEYIRNSILDAKNYFDVGASPPPFKRNQFGGVLGGPIKKDKTFFFVGYEGLRQGQGTTLIATVPTALARQGILPTAVGSTSTVTVPVNPAIVPFLDLYPLPNGRDFGDGTAQFLSAPDIVTNEDNFMVRVDHQVNAKTTIFGRYTFDNDNLNSPQSIPSEVLFLASRRQYATLQANTILGPEALNNVRFAFNRTDSIDNLLSPSNPDLSIIPGQPLGQMTIGGINASGSMALTSLGPSSGNGASTWAYNVFELGDDYSYLTGKHSLKFGGDIERLQDNNQLAQAVRGAYTFSSLNAFLAGTASNLSAESPLGVSSYFGLRQSLYAVYGQDDYTVNSRLTLNLGLRWETTTDPSEAHGKSAILPSPSATSTVVSDKFFSIDKKNFEPRFGLAWRLNANGKTVLRLGGGIYHDQILPWAYWNQLAQPPFFERFSVSKPPFPNGYQILQPGALLALKVVAPFEKTPTDYQYNLSLEQEISRNTVVQVSYVGSRGNHLETLTEADTPIPTFIGGNLGDPFYPAGSPRQNPAFNGIALATMNGNSDYNSGTVTLRRRSSSGFEGQIFYTFSKALDDASGASGAEGRRSPNVLLDPYDRNKDWGLADFDLRHAVVANFSYPTPFRTASKALGFVVNGWTVDGIATFESGMPFTPLLSASVSRDQASTFAERPELNPGFSSSPTHGISAGCPGFPAGSPLGGAANYYDPCAFSLPPAGEYSQNLGRNSIIGPGVADVNLALEKSFKAGEKANVVFRAEMFNVMNHANFGLPNTTALAASGEANPSAGVITYTTTSSRQLQFALRIGF